MSDATINLSDYIRDVPDFPKPGIMFKDIAALLLNPAAFGAAIDQMAALVADEKIDVIAAAEARGFLFEPPLALKMNIGMVPIRKPGKLPYEKHSSTNRDSQKRNHHFVTRFSSRQQDFGCPYCSPPYCSPLSSVSPSSVSRSHSSFLKNK